MLWQGGELLISQNFLPEPPYYAVIFTSIRSGNDERSYGSMAEKMEKLAENEEGYLGIESISDGLKNITVSYWKDEKSIALWKNNTKHLTAQKKGQSLWYEHYTVQISKVERAYRF